MKSRTTGDFWRAYKALPLYIQEAAQKAYALFENNPAHPSLQFKSVNNDPPVYSVRISLNYRALGVKSDDTIIWFWIGSHAEYDQMIGKL